VARSERDSVKDQLVVYTFIILTVGLLVYALVRPYLEKSSQVSRARTANDMHRWAEMCFISRRVKLVVANTLL